MNQRFYKRNLPHVQPLGGTFFITYNLAGSIPKEVSIKLQEEYEIKKSILLKNKADASGYLQLRKKYFIDHDNFLDTNINGFHYLQDDKIAEEVVKSLHHWDGEKLDLICFCIMSNHVHLVMRLYGEHEVGKPEYLHKVLQSIKRHSAKKANIILNKVGQFWQQESFDYLIKDRDELYRIIAYVLDNPIKAGLCHNRGDWKWSYINPEYNEFM